MNATFDEVEQQWKALETGNTVADRIFFEAYFNHLLATKIQAAGYGIRRTESHFELASVSRELVESSAGGQTSSSSLHATNTECLNRRPGR